MKTTRKTLAAVAALILFGAIALAKHRDSRVVYDKPNQVLSTNSPEIVMVPKTATEATYRFSASIETTPPDEPELGRELTGPMYFIARGKIHHGSICIEAKEDMKKRGLASPNRADTLAMSFGVTIAAKSKQSQEERPYPRLKSESAWMY